MTDWLRFPYFFVYFQKTYLLSLKLESFCAFFICLHLPLDFLFVLYPLLLLLLSYNLLSYSERWLKNFTSILSSHWPHFILIANFISLRQNRTKKLFCLSLHSPSFRYLFQPSKYCSQLYYVEEIMNHFVFCQLHFLLFSKNN